jgi:hypothetical protein
MNTLKGLIIEKLKGQYDIILVKIRGLYNFIIGKTRGYESSNMEDEPCNRWVRVFTILFLVLLVCMLYAPSTSNSVDIGYVSVIIACIILLKGMPKQLKSFLQMVMGKPRLCPDLYRFYGRSTLRCII